MQFRSRFHGTHTFPSAARQTGRSHVRHEDVWLHFSFIFESCHILETLIFLGEKYRAKQISWLQLLAKDVICFFKTFPNRSAWLTDHHLTGKWLNWTTSCYWLKFLNITCWKVQGMKNEKKRDWNLLFERMNWLLLTIWVKLLIRLSRILNKRVTSQPFSLFLSPWFSNPPSKTGCCSNFSWMEIKGSLITWLKEKIYCLCSSGAWLNLVHVLSLSPIFANNLRL